MTARGRFARVAALAALGLAGFQLGACGGGEGPPSTATGLTTTRSAATATRSVPTRTTRTEAQPTTTEETETETEPVTTDEETVTEPATTDEETVTEPTTTVEEPSTTASEETAEPASSTSSTPWGWIALALALAGAAVLGLVLWARRRKKAAAWSNGLADLSRRSLLALDDVVAEGSLVTGQVQALCDEARSLESSAPDGPARATAAVLRARLDDLATALEADRKLRLGSTPPSEEQLAYSTSLVHREIGQLQAVLRPADPGQRPA